MCHPWVDFDKNKFFISIFIKENYNKVLTSQRQHPYKECTIIGSILLVKNIIYVLKKKQ
jgi:hypothetical protein